MKAMGIARGILGLKFDLDRGSRAVEPELSYFARWLAIETLDSVLKALPGVAKGALRVI